MYYFNNVETGVVVNEQSIIKMFGTRCDYVIPYSLISNPIYLVVLEEIFGDFECYIYADNNLHIHKDRKIIIFADNNIRLFTRPINRYPERTYAHTSQLLRTIDYEQFTSVQDLIEKHYD